MSILKKKKPAETADAAKTAETAVKVKIARNVKAVIIRPSVTEKASIQQSFNKYTFIVNLAATKPQVKREIIAEYNVTPRAVNFINVQGKPKKSARGPGRRSDYKKAIVTLPKGQSIVIHEGV